MVQYGLRGIEKRCFIDVSTTIGPCRKEDIILGRQVYGWIKLRAENGKTCRFWSDNWSPFSSIS